jgi:hypothetical protein
MHRTLPTIVLAAFAAALTPSLVLAQIAPGNLVVVRVGDGVNPLSSAAQPVFLDEYTPTGALIQSVALPTAPSGANLPLCNSGSATSEGHLNLSADGRYLVHAGYGTAPGTASVAGTSSATTPRVVARVALDGTVDTSTSIGNAISGNNVRSATSSDGSEFWVAGANGGLQHLTLGATSSTALHTTLPLNLRTVAIWNGQLYVTSASGAFQGVSAVGTGVPNTPGQTITLLPGFPTASGPSNYDFFFADAQTLYVADDRTTGGNGGIQKWVESGGTWLLAYTLNPGLAVGCRGLTGTVTAGIATLYATTSGPISANDIVTVTDVGAGSPFTTVVTGAVNTVFRGVRLIPAGGALVRIPHGCGVQTITSAGTGALGSAVTTTTAGATGVPFLGVGLVLVPVPLCATCTLGHEWAVALFGTSIVFNIPNDPAFSGLQVGFQGADLFGTGACAAPPVATTDTIVLTIQ